tara:strand:- start:1838 stop:2212 length:375 start_codon:yes stop_codon:yes gene_type:complete
MQVLEERAIDDSIKNCIFIFCFLHVSFYLQTFNESWLGTAGLILYIIIIVLVLIDTFKFIIATVLLPFLYIASKFDKSWDFDPLWRTTIVMTICTLVYVFSIYNVGCNTGIPLFTHSCEPIVKY